MHIFQLLFYRPIFFAGFGAQMPTGPLDRKLLFIEQVLNFKNQLDILAGIQPLAGGSPFGSHPRKFGFPKPQNIRRQLYNFADFPDPEIKLVGYIFLIGFEIFHFQRHGLARAFRCQAGKLALNCLTSLSAID